MQSDTSGIQLGTWPSKGAGGGTFAHCCPRVSRRTAHRLKAPLTPPNTNHTFDRGVRRYESEPTRPHSQTSSPQSQHPIYYVAVLNRDNTYRYVPANHPLLIQPHPAMLPRPIFPVHLAHRQSNPSPSLADPHRPHTLRRRVYHSEPSKPPLRSHPGPFHSTRRTVGEEQSDPPYVHSSGATRRKRNTGTPRLCSPESPSAPLSPLVSQSRFHTGRRDRMDPPHSDTLPRRALPQQHSSRDPHEEPFSRSSSLENLHLIGSTTCTEPPSFEVDIPTPLPMTNWPFAGSFTPFRSADNLLFHPTPTAPHDDCSNQSRKLSFTAVEFDINKDPNGRRRLSRSEPDLSKHKSTTKHVSYWSRCKSESDLSKHKPNIKHVSWGRWNSEPDLSKHKPNIKHVSWGSCRVSIVDPSDPVKTFPSPSPKPRTITPTQIANLPSTNHEYCEQTPLWDILNACSSHPSEPEKHPNHQPYQHSKALHPAKRHVETKT